MSLAIIEAEIRRFLSDPAPEVLCIQGKWGVGKTYGWQKFLRESQKSEKLAMKRYAYVSLFGLSSLDDLRYALFENTVTGDNIGNDPDTETFSELIKNRDTTRKLKPIADVVSILFNRKGLADLIAKSAFLTVRNQLICFDDLERAGADLGPREVLGLASLLKENRKCKVVLLLNDEEHDQRQEFVRQLEKVSDVTLRFDPTSNEAANIALPEQTPANNIIRPKILQLNITNIRVIKKIERLSLRLIDILKDYDSAIVDEAVAALILASWAVQQPQLAPSLDFLRTYNSISLSMRAGRETLEPEIERFRQIIADYPFKWASDLDRAIIDGAEAGFFNEDRIKEATDALVEERKKDSPDSDFSRAWKDLYHGSLSADDDEFLDALYRSSIKEAGLISALNINSAIRTLREFGRTKEADEVVAAFMTAHENERLEFFDIATHHFSTDDQLDDGFRDAFAARHASYVDPRDPLEVLREMGAKRGWDDRDVALMSKQGADDLVRLFESLKGEEVKASVQMIRAMGHGHGPENVAIERNSREALNKIAAKSPLRTRKVRGLGIPIEAAASVAEESEGIAPSPPKPRRKRKV